MEKRKKKSFVESGEAKCDVPRIERKLKRSSEGPRELGALSLDFVPLVDDSNSKIVFVADFAKRTR